MLAGHVRYNLWQHTRNRAHSLWIPNDRWMPAPRHTRPYSAPNDHYGAPYRKQLSVRFPVMCRPVLSARDVGWPSCPHV